jgi:DNA-binding NtrC family response regulator
MKRILVVDDEKSVRDFFAITLRREGYEVHTAPDGRQALRKLEERSCDVVLTDLMMPKVGGMELLGRIHEQWPRTSVFIITAYGTIENAVEAMRAGAFDYITKPFNVLEVLLKIEKALDRQRLEEEVVSLREGLQAAGDFGALVGRSERMREIFALVERIAGTDSTVLISGQSGTGKELVAREIHGRSGRRDAPFLSVNCGAMPEQLLESELFGHVKGAFTGAVSAKEGLFEAASSGTLFLDEVAETSPGMQVKLLRVLQDGRVRPVGSTQEIETDVRILAASNRDLEERVRHDAFRSDLFYRLSVIPIAVPPLTERREDIPALVEHFLHRYSAKMGRSIQGLSRGAMELLEAYHWPGNVRELENVIERACAIETGEVISPESLPDRLRGVPSGWEGPDAGSWEEQLHSMVEDFLARRSRMGLGTDEFLDELRRRLLEEALRRAAGSKGRAAEVLGLSPRSLRYLVKKYGLEDS